ncbi:proline dehydrogenase family protein [Catelliglobosispora koreensis]|uniref:proline dehydrogenase family protein n=1 Tax=Catelliglobosispora koreensis TaxID=129052 RepID=UPI00037B1896|nr:proline dehydrogenase family protein [Catelliglobosispora koreensis]
MLRKALLATADRPRLSGWLQSTPAGRAVVARFVAGHDTLSVLNSAETLAAQELRVTIDHLGEYTTEVSQAMAIRDEYLRLLDLLATTRLTAADVSLKLSALGQTLANGDELAFANAYAICEAAAAAGATVTLDMEDHTTTDSTLDILGRLRFSGHRSVGVALQAGLRRTATDVLHLAKDGCRIRLCKGAYAEPAEVAYQRRRDVEQAFRHGIDILMSQPSCYPMIATHNPALISYAQASARQHHRGAGDHEYQMLYGVRPHEQRRLVHAGHPVRVYLPYGTDSTAYFLRRLAERPANLAFFLRALTAKS